MRSMLQTLIAAAALAALASPALAQSQSAEAMKDRSYVGQMSEEQVRQKIQGEGFSEVSEIKKIPVTKYRWTAKAKRAGKPMEVTIDELGHISAK